MIVCLTPPQMNDICDLLGTPYAQVSKIAPVKGHFLSGPKLGLGLDVEADIQILRVI